MIAAVEKQKFVYIMNRDSNNKLTISSPLEAHKSHTIIFDICGVDVGYENPLFACLESDYGEVEEKDSPMVTGIPEKSLTFYEMDLGLNHVVRKNTQRIDPTANYIITVPGGKDGPGGVLICCEGFLVYESYPLGNSHKVRYPRRIGDFSGNKPLINCYASYKQKNFFFYLLQNEYGDIFKLTLSSNTDEGAANLQINMLYLDTIPPCCNISVMKKGYMFAASETGNHGLYAFKSLGEDSEDAVFTSNLEMEEEDIYANSETNSQLEEQGKSKAKEAYFWPRKIWNLKLVEEWESMSCVADTKVEDLLGEGSNQIYNLCAAGNRSTLRILKHGIAVTEMAAKKLPKKPNAVLTIKEKNSDEYDKYIILSFQTATIVLQIEDQIVEDLNTFFETKKATLLVNLMEDDSQVQVYSSGIRHISKDRKIQVCPQPENVKIVKAAANSKQLVISVTGGDLIYFEQDEAGGLNEIEKITVDTEILAIDIPKIPEDRQRAKFMAVGFQDNSVKIYSLDIESCLLKLSMQVFPYSPESVAIVEYNTSELEDEYDEERKLFQHIGLNNGSLYRTAIDQTTGALTETRSRFLGSKPLKLFKFDVQKTPLIMALTSTPWVAYMSQGKYQMTPLIYKNLDYVYNFHSKICPHGVVGISADTLYIFKIKKLGELFHQTCIPLLYTPRKMVVHPESKSLVIIESSHRTYPSNESTEIVKKLIEEHPTVKNPPNPAEYRPIAPEGKWASCVRIYSPSENKTTDLFELKNNEHPLCLSIINFSEYKDDHFQLIGSVKDYVMVPQSYSSSLVHTFIFDEGGNTFQILHTTVMDSIVQSIAPFKGKTLLGIGHMLRLYDIGKRQLLKKCEYKHLYVGVNTIQTIGERIFITDMSDSFHQLKYKPRENQFVEIADDVLPRWITSAAILDYHTLVGADKFENQFVCRLPDSIDEEINEDFFTYKFKWEAGYLNGAACKVIFPQKYFLIKKVRTNLLLLLRGASDDCDEKGLDSDYKGTDIFHHQYGKYGCVIPNGVKRGMFHFFLQKKKEIDFFVHLEMYLRMECQPLAGRDHMAFRSFHGSVKVLFSYLKILNQNVVDGDLCDQFLSLESSKQRLLADELDRTPSEVCKKLEDLKNHII